MSKNIQKLVENTSRAAEKQIGIYDWELDKIDHEGCEKTPKSDENIGSGLSETTELMSEKSRKMSILREREFSKKTRDFKISFSMQDDNFCFDTMLFFIL